MSLGGKRRISYSQIYAIRAFSLLLSSLSKTSLWMVVIPTVDTDKKGIEVAIGSNLHRIHKYQPCLACYDFQRPESGVGSFGRLQRSL